MLNMSNTVQNYTSCRRKSQISHGPQSYRKQIKNVQNPFHVQQWIHKCVNMTSHILAVLKLFTFIKPVTISGKIKVSVYKVMSICNSICVFFGFDFTQHKCKNISLWIMK